MCTAYRVEIALAAGPVDAFEERVVVAGEPAEHDGRVRIGGLDAGVGGLQQLRICGGVGAARPPARRVLLVPDLIRADPPRPAPGEGPEEGGVVGGVRGRSVRIARARLPFGRLDDVEDDFRAGGKRRKKPFVFGEPVRGEYAALRLQVGPREEDPYPLNAQRPDVADLSAIGGGYHDAWFDGPRNQWPRGAGDCDYACRDCDREQAAQER